MEYNEFNQEDEWQIARKKLNTGNKSKHSKKNNKKAQKKKIYKKMFLLVPLTIIIAVIVIFVNKNNEIKNFKEEEINLVINSNNVTSKLKNSVIKKDDDIYVSMEDIKNYFDSYIQLEESINKIITTGDIATAEISFEEDESIVINGSTTKVKANAITQNNKIYLPISKMSNIYNIDVNYIEETNIVVINSIDREIKQATVAKDVIVREKKRNLFSNALEKISKGNTVYIASDDSKGWTKVRTTNGKVGYVKTKLLTDIKVIQEEYSFYEENKIDGKINMFWDYFTEKSSAPDRTGEYIEGVNVVSPTFFYIDKNGNLQENIGEAGEKYIEWANSNNYMIWPRVSNDTAGIDVTSDLLNDYSSRKQLISDLVNACMIYGFDGINVDFENMYEEDKDEFSKLIIEMVPVMKGSGGLIVSVDVTAPNGSSTWSLCYDRNVLGDVADYLVFMAYDQYNTKVAGTNAGYNWVETNIKKFVGSQEEVDSEKLILGIPFYARIWTVTSTDVVSKTIDMKDISSQIPSDASKEWDDDLKQYYVEYVSGNTTKKIWVEDLESIKAKCELVKKYNLAGVAAWEKDREDPDVWEVINSTIN